MKHCKARSCVNFTLAPLFALALSNAASAAPQFDEVAGQIGIGFQAESIPSTSPYRGTESMGNGVAWLDFDKDGYLDLFVPNARSYNEDPVNGGPSRLYRNTGPDAAGIYRFSLVNLAPAIDSLLRGQVSTGVVTADYDGDTFVDLFITNVGRNTLLRNIDDGQGGRGFSDVTASAGLNPQSVINRRSYAAAFGDLDNDGDLDLYVGNWSGRGGNPAPVFADGCDQNELYMNNGNGTFRRAPVSAEANDPGCTFGVALSDYDNDGDLDIFTANDSVIFGFSFTLFSIDVFPWSQLHQNQGASVFGGSAAFTHQRDASRLDLVTEDVYSSCWGGLSSIPCNDLSVLMNAMGIAVGDYNNDGHLDYHRTNINNGLLNTANGDGTFRTEIFGGLPSGSGSPYGWGTAFTDVDNDGDIDLVYANQGVNPAFPASEINHLHMNTNGQLSHTNSAVAAGLGVTAMSGRGLAVADYNQDGREDIAIHNGDGNVWLYKNITDDGNNWITVALEGLAPNTQGIGAKIQVSTNAGPQLREVSAGASHSSSHSTEQTFGTGGDSIIAVLVVWPSGCLQGPLLRAANTRTVLREADCTAN